jgi:hypothetical protein
MKFFSISFKSPMLTSALVLMTILPWQISPNGQNAMPLNHPLTVAVFIDCAKILGLPKFRLRDSNGNRYQPHKSLMQEPMAVLQQSVGVMYYSPNSPNSLRKAYIQSYVKR